MHDAEAESKERRALARLRSEPWASSARWNHGGGATAERGRGHQGVDGPGRATFYTFEGITSMAEPSKPTPRSPKSTAASSLTRFCQDFERRAYITLMTRASYLAGVVLLAHSLQRQGSRYPLIVLYTETLSQTALEVLALEATCSKLVLRRCELLKPREDLVLNLAVERFTDTWTKLRVFEAFDLPFDVFCYLDADIQSSKTWTLWSTVSIFLNCVCNTGTRGAWTPVDHVPQNCPFTPQTHPQALKHPMQPTASSQSTHQLFNSGMFLCRPNRHLWKDIINFFNTSDLLSTFALPDQSLMTYFFRGRWIALGWQYNAVKTMAYRHMPIWRDEEVVCLHYINDKPWDKRNRRDGTAGLRGMDGKTHMWWWHAFQNWVATRTVERNNDVVRIVTDHVAWPEEGRDDDNDKPAHDDGSASAEFCSGRDGREGHAADQWTDAPSAKRK